MVLLAAVGGVLLHAFLARGRAAVPVLAALLGVALYTALGGTTAASWGYRGLAFLHTLGVGTAAFVALIALLIDLGRPRGEGLPRSLLSMVAAGAAVTAALILTGGFLPEPGEPVVLRVAVLAVVGLVSLAVYLGVLALTRNPHLALLIRSLVRRGEG